jgi:hypothetical protein
LIFPPKTLSKRNQELIQRYRNPVKEFWWLSFPNGQKNFCSKGDDMEPIYKLLLRSIKLAKSEKELLQKIFFGKDICKLLTGTLQILLDEKEI